MGHGPFLFSVVYGLARLFAQRDGHGPVHRHGGHAVLRRAVDELFGVGEVDQRVAGRGDHAHDAQALEQDGHAFAEHLFLLLERLGEADRPHLAAGDGGFSAVFGQAQGALDAARACARDVAGHAQHAGVVIGFHEDVVVAADPLEGGVHRADFFARRCLRWARWARASSTWSTSTRHRSPGCRRARAASMAMNSPRISSTCVVRDAPARPSRSRAITSPSARPRWAASWYRITSSNAAPRITVWSRISSSRRSPAPLITTLRRLAGRASTAPTRARMASGLWP